MATGTLAKLYIALGLETTGIVTGMALAQKQLRSGLSTMQAEADAAGARGKSNLLSMGNVALGVVGTVGVVAAGLVDLAVKFESETAHVSAAMGVTKEKAQEITNAFVDNAGKTIYSSQTQIDAFAAVAGQLDKTVGHILSVDEALQINAQAQYLAGAASVPLEEAYHAISDEMQAYSLNAGDAANVSNLLFNASKDLNEPLGALATTADKLHGMLGPLAPDLKGTYTLIEEAASKGIDIVKNQRLLMQFVGGITTMADPTKDINALTKAQKALATAQDQLTRAQQTSATTRARTKAATDPIIDAAADAAVVARVAADQEKLNTAIGKWGPQSQQATSATAAFDSAQASLAKDLRGNTVVIDAHSNVISGHATAVERAQQKVAAAQIAVSKATLAATGTFTLLDGTMVHIYDSAGKFAGIQSIFAQLQPSFAKMTDIQRQQEAVALFGTKAASEMIPLIMGGSAAWDKYSTDLSKAGTAQDGYGRATDNIADKWRTFISGITAEGTKISIAMEPFINNILGWLLYHLPDIQHGFEIAFGVAGNVLSAFWSVAGPVFGFFIDHWPILLALLGLWLLRWTAIKALNFTKEILGWVGAFKQLLSADIVSGLGKFTRLGSNIDGVKNAWKGLSDLSKTPVSLAISPLAPDMAKNIENALQASFKHSIDTGEFTKVGDVINRSLVADTGKISTTLSELISRSKVGATLADDMAKGLTIDSARIANVITKIATDAKIGSTIANDISKAASLGNAAANDISKIGGGAAGRILGKFTALLSQPVWIVGSNPGSLLAGQGGLPGNLTNPLKTAEKTVQNDVTKTVANDAAKAAEAALAAKTAQGLLPVAVETAAPVAEGAGGLSIAGVAGSIGALAAETGAAVAAIGTVEFWGPVAAAVAAFGGAMWLLGQHGPSVADTVKTIDNNIKNLPTDPYKTLPSTNDLAAMADVVRNLLKDTGSSSDDIRHMINNVQFAVDIGMADTPSHIASFIKLWEQGDHDTQDIINKINAVDATIAKVDAFWQTQLSSNFGLGTPPSIIDPKVKKDINDKIAGLLPKVPTTLPTWPGGVPSTAPVWKPPTLSGADIDKAFSAIVNNKDLALTPGIISDMKQHIEIAAGDSYDISKQMHDGSLSIAGVSDGFSILAGTATDLFNPMDTLSTELGLAATDATVFRNLLHNLAHPSAPFPGLGGASVTPNSSSSSSDYYSMFSHAMGGYIRPGEWGMTSEQGPEPIFGGKTGVTVLPAGMSRIAGSSGQRPSRTVHVGQITVNNPAPEPASESIQYNLRNLSMLGVRE